MSVNMREHMGMQMQMDYSYCPEIEEYRKQLAKKYASFLNQDFMNDFRSQNFMVPKRLEGKACSGLSSHSTADSSDLDAHSGQSSKSSMDCSKRLNKITELLLRFEEKCALDAIISPTELRSLRSLNRGILGKVVDNFTLFKHQHSVLVAINILMFNCSKMKIPKDSFKDVISELFQKIGQKDITIYSIKKSKTYSLIKQVIKSQF